VNRDQNSWRSQELFSFFGASFFILASQETDSLFLFLSLSLSLAKMGQPLPLPQRIPRLNLESDEGKKLLQALSNVGITLEESTECYVRYTMPSSWKMVDDSLRQDLPRFHMVDEKNLIHFTVSGSWKGSYDNKLQLIQVEPPRLFESKNQNEPLIPSETSDEELLGRFAEVFDPLHRPPTNNALSAQRQADYSTNQQTL
jgi:hypothetical protein